MNDPSEWCAELAEYYGSAYDPAYKPIWYDSWHGHEAWSFICILHSDNRLWLLEGGDWLGCANQPCWNPALISDTAALAAIMFNWYSHSDT